jgi:hypothetical protein
VELRVEVEERTPSTERPVGRRASGESKLSVRCRGEGSISSKRSSGSPCSWRTSRGLSTNALSSELRPACTATRTDALSSPAPATESGSTN